MSSRLRNSPNTSNKLRFESLNKILKIDVGKSIRKQRRSTIAKGVSTIALSELLKNTPSRLQNIPDFKVFLSNEENVQLFRDFLITQYCHENLDFYLACERYRNLDPDKVGKDLVKFMATQIYNDYLCENARQPINVDEYCKRNIASQMKNPGLDLLVEAQTEIFNLMRADCYPRFCKTWQLDKETARKILCVRALEIPRNRKKSPDANRGRSTTKSPTSDLTTTSLNTTMYSDDSLMSKRRVLPHSNTDCPPDCLYNRIGLPCQQHHNGKEKHVNQKHCSDSIGKIDLKKVQGIPKDLSMRSPPPPPLPPKPRRYQTRSSPANGPKCHPYIGKAFYV